MAYAQINLTGCGIHKNRAKLRLDFFLNPDEPNYNGDTPFHSHFIYPDKNTSDADIKAEIEKCLNYFYAFHQYCWDKGLNFIDEWKKVPSRKGQVRQPFVKGEAKDVKANKAKVQNIVKRAKSFQVGIAKVPPQDLDIGEKGTIDVGSAVIDRQSTQALSSSTWVQTVIDFNNPANAAGVIDTVEAYFSTASEGNVFRVGTFQDDGSGDFTCHDAEEIGEVESTGYNKFTGLSIDIDEGEYIGADSDTVGHYLVIEYGPSGSGVYVAFAESYCDPSDSGHFNDAPYAISLYGTGTEGVGNHLLAEDTNTLLIDENILLVQ